jgi:EmrB/QacA subfamily drug resistance transporter
MLVASRGLMGVGGACIMPSTLSIVTAIFPPEERAKAIGAWAGVAGLGIGLGPVAGGWLIENFDWNAVFLVNIPIAVAAMAFGSVLIPESRDPNATPVDPLGVVLSTAGLVSLVWAVIEAPIKGWDSTEVIVGLIAGVVILTLFGIAEWRSSHPMLQIELFKNRRFSSASTSIALIFFALFGSIFLLTQYMQWVLGYSPLEAGIRTLPIALSMMIMGPLSARIVERVGTKVVVTIGFILVASGLYTLSSLTVSSDYWPHVALGQLLIGLGMSSAMAPATEAVMGAIPRDRAGAGAAMNNTMRMVGGSFGVAILGSILSGAYRPAVHPIVTQLQGKAGGAVKDSLGAAIKVAHGVGHQLSPHAGNLIEHAVKVSWVDGMETTMLAAAIVAVLGALVAAAFLPARAALAPPLPAAGEDSGPIGAAEPATSVAA